MTSLENESVILDVVVPGDTFVFNGQTYNIPPGGELIIPVYYHYPHGGEIPTAVVVDTVGIPVATQEPVVEDSLSLHPQDDIPIITTRRFELVLYLIFFLYTSAACTLTVAGIVFATDRSDEYIIMCCFLAWFRPIIVLVVHTCLPRVCVFFGGCMLTLSVYVLVESALAVRRGYALVAAGTFMFEAVFVAAGVFFVVRICVGGK
jgi:hypothetical protein